MKYTKIIITTILLAIMACSRMGVNQEEVSIPEVDYKYTEGDVEVLFTQVVTKDGDSDNSLRWAQYISVV